MRILVIPDIHLKAWLFDHADEILKSNRADRAICLMDIPDDWDMEFQVERYKDTYDRAIVFAAAHPDILCRTSQGMVSGSRDQVCQRVGKQE